MHCSASDALVFIRSPFLFGVIAVFATVFLFGCSSSSMNSNMKTMKIDSPVVQGPPPVSKKSPEDSILNERSVEELLKTGDTLMQKDNQQMATLYYAMAAKKDPASPRAQVGLGQISLMQGDQDKAQNYFRNALKSDPQNVGALLGLGKISRNKAEYGKAIDYFNQALSIDPEGARILTELAITYDLMGQETLSEPLYAKVSELFPYLPSAHNNLGFNYLLQGRYPEAITSFQRALALAPNNHRTQNNLGTAYALSGQEDLALDMFERSVGKPEAYNNLGFIYMTQGDWDKAEAAFQKALNLKPSFYPRAYENLERLKLMRQNSSH